MPPSADDLDSNRSSAELPQAPVAPPSADAPAAAPHSPTEPAAHGETTPAEVRAAGEPHRHRRRRGRRRPREFGPPSLAAAEASGVPDVANPERPNTEGTSGETAGLNLASDAAGSGQAATDPVASAAAMPAVPHDASAGERAHRRRRRRRRPPANAPSAAPGGLGSALPAVDAAVAQPDGDSPALAQTGAGSQAGEAGSQRAILHLRRPVRGRRQLPRPPGLQRGVTATAPSGAGDQPAADPAAAQGAPAADGSATPRAEGEFPRRRRRRRPPRSGEAGLAAEREAAPTVHEPNRPPRRRGGFRPGEDRTGGALPQRARNGDSERRGPGRGPREREAGPSARRERSARAERGPRGGGQRGRGRDAMRRPVEQKLYALEAMVDRGFEDVPDDATEDGSRRVHWTIVKRTVADQKSGKAMSATYVLQREGGETEFPNLGAARAAANKTIIHPEKLTMSKAEHAAAKGSK